MEGRGLLRIHPSRRQGKMQFHRTDHCFLVGRSSTLPSFDLTDEVSVNIFRAIFPLPRSGANLKLLSDTKPHRLLDPEVEECPLKSSNIEFRFLIFARHSRL